MICPGFSRQKIAGVSVVAVEVFVVVTASVDIGSKIFRLEGERTVNQPVLRSKAVITADLPRSWIVLITDAQVARIEHICPVDVCSGKGEESHSSSSPALSGWGADYVAIGCELRIHSSVAGRDSHMHELGFVYHPGPACDAADAFPARVT